MTMWCLFLAGCGWWEARQACSAAQEAESAGWTTFARVAEDAAIAADSSSAAQLEAANAVGTAQLAAEQQAPDGVRPNAAAAQDAFTAASRVGGDAQQAATDARAADYATRTLAVSDAAERAADRAAHEAERLALWGEVYRQSGLSLALAAARYESLVRAHGLPAGQEISLDLAESLTPANPEDPAAVAALASVERRRAAFGEVRAQFEALLVEGESIAFAADRAGQMALTRGGDIDFLDLPLSAQYARSAAAAALAAGGRATGAARQFRDVLADWKSKIAQSGVQAPPETKSALLAAKEHSARAESLCR